MLPSHHLNNYIRPLNPPHARPSARGASTPSIPGCPSQSAYARERNPSAPLSNLRATFHQAPVQAPVPVSSPRSNTIIRPMPYIPCQQDDRRRKGQHLTPPTCEHETPNYHGIVANINRQEDATYAARNPGDTIVEEPSTAVPITMDRHSKTDDEHYRACARLEYSMSRAIKKHEIRTGKEYAHPRQHHSNSELLGTVDTPPAAPPQPYQTGYQVSALRATILLSIALLSLFSTILAICLFLIAKTKPWSTSAQTCLLVWMTVSIGVSFISLFSFCKLGRVEQGGCLGIEIGRGWGLLSIRPTHNRSDEQTARVEAIELSSLDENGRRATCERSRRDGDGRHGDEHHGGARPACLTTRFSFEPGNISGTSRAQADTATSSESDRVSSLHPGFDKKDPLSLLPYPSFPKVATIHTPSRIQQFKHNFGGLNQPQRTNSVKIDHKRARHPPLLGRSYPDFITQEQLLQFQKEQHEVREKYQQEYQQVRRKVWLESKQRSDTPREKRPNLRPRTCSDISLIEEVQTPIVLQKTRGPLLRTSDAASPSIVAIKDPQQGRPTHLQAPAGSRQQKVADTRILEHRNTPFPAIPYENKDLAKYPSPPSSYEGSVIRRLPTHVSVEGSERLTASSVLSEHEDDATDNISATQTPPTLSASLTEFDRHLRNSGAVELDKFLTNNRSEDKYPEVQPSPLDSVLEQRCRGRNQERAWFRAHLAQHKNLLAMEDPELDLDAEIGAAREDPRYIPYSARTPFVQGLTSPDGPAPEAVTETPASSTPSWRSVYSSSQSSDEDSEYLSGVPVVPVVHAEPSKTQYPIPASRVNPRHHVFPRVSPTGDHNNAKARHETHASTKECITATTSSLSKPRAARRNEIIYSPLSIPLFSHASQTARNISHNTNNNRNHGSITENRDNSNNGSSVNPLAQRSRPLGPRSIHTIYPSAKKSDERAHESVAAAGIWMDESSRAQSEGLVISDKGEAQSVKYGHSHGGAFSSKRGDEYEDKENVDPSDIGVAL